MANGLKRGALLAAGYGLARAVTSNAYTTAFGVESGTATGFVAQMPFSLVTNVLSAALALALVALVLRGFARGGVAPETRGSGAAAGVSSSLWSFAGGRLPLGALALSALLVALGYVCGVAGLFSLMGPAAGNAACALVYAVGSVVLTLAWFEPFAREPEVGVAVQGLVFGFLVQAGGYFCLALLSGWALFAAVLAALGVSVAARVVLGRLTVAATEAGSAAATGSSNTCTDGMAGAFDLLKGALRELFGSFLCVFVLTAVVGLIHTSVIGNSFENVVGAVPMSEALVLAAVLLAVVVLIARRAPEADTVYRVLFPLMLVALSALPFIPEAFGHYAGMVMVVCYDLVGMAFVLYLVEVAHRMPVPPVALMGVYQAGTQLFLVVGLVLGILLNHLEARVSASYATILILVCIYLLAMVPAVLSRRRTGEARGAARGGFAMAGAGAAGGAATMAQPKRGAWGADAAQTGRSVASDEGQAAPGISAEQIAEENFERQQEVRSRVGARVEEFAVEKGLTAREAQVLVQLARGWSANAIAADLGIAQNTAWAHIKRIYVKLDVHSKQELIEYVEREVINRPEG